MFSFPSLFVSHGSPMLALEPGKTGPLLSSIGNKLPRPRAILIVSTALGNADAARWQSDRATRDP